MLLKTSQKYNLRNKNKKISNITDGRLIALTDDGDPARPQATQTSKISSCVPRSPETHKDPPTPPKLQTFSILLRVGGDPRAERGKCSKAANQPPQVATTQHQPPPWTTHGDPPWASTVHKSTTNLIYFWAKIYFIFVGIGIDLYGIWWVLCWCWNGYDFVLELNSVVVSPVFLFPPEVRRNLGFFSANQFQKNC